jgi:hypothetical protein
LVAICQDSLYDTATAQDSMPIEVAVMVDARTAAVDGGQTGVAVLAGPRIGPRALREIFCNGIVQVIAIAEDGTPLSVGRRSRNIPPKLRRFILARDKGCCAEGCSSRYRLEVHHCTPWSQGGATDADSLVTLCWFHHHVAVHRQGFELVRIGQSRVRLKRPN